MISIAKWVHSIQGATHLIASIIGLLVGAYLLIAAKGTNMHRTLGKLFSYSLIIVNVSALFIYDFNDGSIGPFHYLIPVSLGFLMYGWIPMLRKKKAKNYMYQHIIGMVGASLGLWAAGATEYFVREVATDQMDKGLLILYSFMISVPFAILITILITVYIGREKAKRMDV